MVSSPDPSRPATPADHRDIDALLRAAFPGADEAELVHQLREGGEMLSEVVTPWHGRIVGYYALSRMRAPAGWACLAPVAVLPAYQNGAQGVHLGSKLMHDLVTSIRRSSAIDTVVVLGDPPFYARAGFSLERAARLNSPYPIDHTLILRPGNDRPQAELIYPAAFG